MFCDSDWAVVEFVNGSMIAGRAAIENIGGAACVVVNIQSVEVSGTVFPPAECTVPLTSVLMIHKANREDALEMTRECRVKQIAERASNASQ